MTGISSDRVVVCIGQSAVVGNTNICDCDNFFFCMMCSLTSVVRGFNDEGKL